MLEFIGFGFKLLLSAIIGGALSYVPGEKEGEQKIVETSLICIFSAAILGLASQSVGIDNNVTIGLSILAVIISLIFISKNLDFANRMMWLFAGVTGMIIGAGYIFQAALLSVLVYIIFRNSENLLNFLSKESTNQGDTTIENLSN